MVQASRNEGGATEAEEELQLTPYGVTIPQSIVLPKLLEYRGEKRVRKKLFEGAQFWAEMVCYEPGQSTPSHHHPKEDELFLTLEGHGTIITADGTQLDAPTGSLVTVPATIKHELRNTGTERWAVLFVKLSRAYGKPAAS